MKIESIETFIVVATIRPELMITSSLGVHSRTRVALVRMTTRDPELQGWGEATVTPVWSGETADGACALIEGVLAPLLIGLPLDSLEDVEAASRRMEGAVWGNPFARSAIEMAALDALGKAQGLPVYRLLGGPVRDARIPIRFSIGAVPPAEAARRAAARVAWGHTTIKVKVGRNPEEDLQRVRAVRSEIGAGIKLTVDANGGWSEEDAISTLRAMEPLNLDLAEQPVRREDLEGLARVRRAAPQPVMADEAVFTLWEAQQALKLNCCDIIALYPGKNGGLLQSRAISRMAEEQGVACAVGSNLELEPGTAAMCHLTRACTGILSDRFHGDILGPLYHEASLTRLPIRFEEGHVWCPEGPGLGIEMAPDQFEQGSAA